METGKVLSLLSGIITIVATYFFSWYAIDTVPPYYANGLGIINNLGAMFTDAENLGSVLNIPGFSLYIIAVGFILFLVAGLFLILGMKKRGFAAFGTLLVLGMATLIYLGSYRVISVNDWITNILGTDSPLVEDIIPLKILDFGGFDIGMYLLYVGGILGLVATVYGPGAF